MQISNEPMHHQLAELFRQNIASATWSQGDCLPSEAELGAAHGVSRGTVRHALASLRHEGLIVGGRGKPPTVARSVPSQPFATFMSFTEWAQSIGKAPGQQTYEIARRRAKSETAACMGLAVGEPVVQLVRLRLLDEVPVMLERGTFAFEVGQLLFEFDTDTGSIFGYFTAQGIEISRGKHLIDAVSADEIDASLLGIEIGAPLLRERRVTYGGEGQILECSDDRYLPQAANFVIENTREARAALARVPRNA
ncbi:GntR family transcriptional regulator [Arthrobacter sp. MYb227]|nr:GntR family transcriptional regulator [Arthrobacter sp. MYb227]